MIPEDLRSALDGWLYPYCVKEISKTGNGLINTTYLIETVKDSANESCDFILQKINTAIFKDVDGLMSNIEKVTNFLRVKLVSRGVEDVSRRVLTIKYFYDNQGRHSYFKDRNGECWRVYLKISNAKSFERMENSSMAELAGRAFGKFHESLSGFDASSLIEVLPGFHNTPMRIENFINKIELDRVGRLSEVQEEVDFLLERRERYSQVVKMGREGMLPIRVVHQDTKFNNVLLDENNDILCVIDLDTIMPGYICYDVGDAIRSGANTGDEDDQDLTRVSMDIEIFRGFVKGFIASTRNFISEQEIKTIAQGPLLLTYEQSVRFLDDYLDGDRYYRCNPEIFKHNLVRARAQIKRVTKK
ncbi:MAG: aminoglycoside phosphotransferase family protein [Bacteroidales bacterium]